MNHALKITNLYQLREYLKYKNKLNGESSTKPVVTINCPRLTWVLTSEMWCPPSDLKGILAEAYRQSRFEFQNLK